MFVFFSLIFSRFPYFSWIFFYEKCNSFHLFQVKKEENQHVIYDTFLTYFNLKKQSEMLL